EVQLREALHQAGADTREVGEIDQRNGALHLRLWAPTTGRKTQILAAIGAIPYLTPEIYDAETATADLPPVAPPRQLYSTQPPLADRLRRFLGGVDSANGYLDEVRDAYLTLLPD